MDERGVHMGDNWFITVFVGSAAEKISNVSLFTTHGSSSELDLILSVAIQSLFVIGLTEAILRVKHSAKSQVLSSRGA
jgi:hypothetical protein